MELVSESFKTVYAQFTQLMSTVIN